MKKLIILLALLSSTAFAQSNTLYIEQSGAGFSGTVVQDGSTNRIGTSASPSIINGTTNTLTVNQIGSSNLLDFTVYGDTNTISITNTGVPASTYGSATATPVFAVNAQGQITSVTNTTITPAIGDTSGTGASVAVNLQGRYGTIRSYYNDTVNGKVIVSPNTGSIDYSAGTVTLNNIAPVSIDNTLGELTISIKPKTNLISSSLNNIISIDPYDPAAVNITATAKR